MFCAHGFFNYTDQFISPPNLPEGTPNGLYRLPPPEPPGSPEQQEQQEPPPLFPFSFFV